MINKQIEEALIEFNKLSLTPEQYEILHPLVGLAQLFLSVKGAPEKDNDHLCDKEYQSRTNPEPCIACIKNKIIDAFTAWLAGRVKEILFIIDEVKKEITEEILSQSQYPNIGKKGCLKKVIRIENTIKTMIMEGK